MCGIAGIVRSKGLEPVDRIAVEQMKTALRHRGPDGEGMHFDEVCGLAQTRLAVVSLKPHELPQSSLNRYRIVFNGEIYNFRELKKELSSRFHFHTDTDTEVIVAAWHTWGIDSLNRLDGMYSFFIWDDVKKTGIAARDPLGVKPFFFTYSPAVFKFASEPQALIRSGAHRFAIDDEGFSELLVAPYFSGAVRTPFSGINVLRPGLCIEIKDGHLRELSDRSFKFERPTVNTSIDQLDAALIHSTRAALKADTDVGLFLSGGVDSTLLASLGQKASVTPLKSWTINYSDDTEKDYESSLILKSADLPYAKKAAAAIGLDHRVVNVALGEFDDWLEETLEGNDLGCAWEQEVSQRILGYHSSKEVKAVLVGDAADETHFGYSFLLNDEIVASPANILNYFGAVPLNSKWLSNSTEHFTQKYQAHAELKGFDWATTAEARLATATLVIDHWLPRLLYNGDRHTMAFSLEARVPFAMNQVLAAAKSVSPAHAIENGIEKYFLRSVAARHLSDQLAWRPKSALTKSMKSRGRIFAELSKKWSESGELITPYVQEAFVKKLLQIPIESRTDRDTSLAFRILSAMTWMRQFV